MTKTLHINTLKLHIPVYSITYHTLLLHTPYTLNPPTPE
jgi:hypothetical protein